MNQAHSNAGEKLCLIQDLILLHQGIFQRQLQFHQNPLVCVLELTVCETLSIEPAYLR